MENKNINSKYRTEEEKKYLTKRLNVIEGQVRGIKQMIENDRNCEEIIMQMSAINKSLKSLSNNIIKNYLSNHIIDDIKNNKLESIDEVFSLFEIVNK